MKHISELSEILQTKLRWDKRKVDCLAQLILGMINLRTVSIVSLADTLLGSAKRDSKSRRIQRLLDSWPVRCDWISLMLLGWFFDASDKLTLTMDRTNWKIGKANINFLVVGVTYKRIAIPIVWMLLNKQGNSNFDERVAIISRVFSLIPKDRCANLLCDREFVGEHWLKWLLQSSIPFKIRIKHNYKTQTARGKETTTKALFYSLRPGEVRHLPKPRQVTGVQLYLTGSRLKSGDLMIVASHEFVDQAIHNYLERWEIETFFQCAKGRGFNFEDTRIIDPKRLNALMGIMSMAFAWCYRAGIWAVDQGDLVRRKNHGRPERSIFRHGLDQIRRVTLAGLSWKNLKPLVGLWRDVAPIPRLVVL